MMPRSLQSALALGLVLLVAGCAKPDASATPSETGQSNEANPPGQELPAGHPQLEATTSQAVEQPEGGMTVAEVHARAAEFAGQSVALRGRVVKANFGIMGSNWLHVQDGSGDPATGSNDLTVTTQGRAEVGDLVTVRGVVAADKDFGAGYRYSVIVENAEVVVEPVPLE